MKEMFIFCFIGTIGFTLIGCLFSCLGSKINPKITEFLKGLTTSTIIVLLITHIIKESLEKGVESFKNIGVLLTILIICATFILFLLLHKLFDKKICAHQHHDECCETHDVHIKKDKSLLFSSIVFLISISLHNIPEGLALGTTFLENVTSGIIMSLVVFGLHNFVIGYSVCDSFLKSNISKTNSILLTCLSSFLCYIFAILGYFLGNINEVINFVMLSISAGAILFISLKELIPSTLKNHSDITTISIAIGIILTILIFLFI